MPWKKCNKCGDVFIEDDSLCPGCKRDLMEDGEYLVADAAEAGRHEAERIRDLWRFEAIIS